MSDGVGGLSLHIFIFSFLTQTKPGCNEYSKGWRFFPFARKNKMEWQTREETWNKNVIYLEETEK